MKVLITGASGFIGKYLLEFLKNNTSYEVYGLTRKEITSEDFLMCDYSSENLKDIFLRYNIDIIIHLAAIRGKDKGIKQFQGNEILTENILNAMKEAKVKHIIFLSSIAVYSDVTKIPWTEEQIITPKTCYGITKAACEYLIELYAKEHQYSYTILRVAQVLGLGETHTGMMNKFIEQAYDKQELKVFGKSEAKREFVYIKDIANVINKIVKDHKRCLGVYNLGSMEAHSNLQIAKMINSVFGNSKLYYQDEIPENIESSMMNSRKLYETIDFIPTPLNKAFEEILKEMRRRNDLQ